MEELEAVDWYAQRVDATDDARARRGARAQPRRGEGARGHDDRVAAPSTTPSSTSTCARISSPTARSPRSKPRPRPVPTPPGRPDRSASVRSATTEQPDEPPVARARPHHRRGVGGDRRRSPHAPSSVSSRRAAWSTSKVRTAGTTPPRARAGCRRRRRRSRFPACTCSVRKVISAVELRVPFRVSRAELGPDRPRRHRSSTSTISTMPRASSPTPRTRPCSKAPSRPNIDGHRRRRPRIRRSRSKAASTTYPRAVAWAVERLREAGINGPYGIVAQPGRVHRCRRDDRARRLSRLRPRAAHPRRTDRVGPGH